MPERDPNIYADLYGEEDEDFLPLPETDDVTAKEVANTTSMAASGSPSREQGNVRSSAGTSLQPMSTNPKPGTSSYASQVAQQFSAYQKHVALPTSATKEPAIFSPVEPPSVPQSLPLPSSQTMTQENTQHIQSTPVRPSEMKDEGKMFIGGLNWDTSDESLRDYMSNFGAVDACTIMRDPSGRSRGFAFLTFEGPGSVEAVLAQGEHILDGKVIDPKRAVPRQEYLRHQRVFVGGLAPSVTSSSLRAHFCQYGEVVDCMVMLDRDTNRSKGFGFVTYNDAAGMEAVLATGAIELDGKVIEVKEATPRGPQQRTNPRNQQEEHTNEINQNSSTNMSWNTAPPVVNALLYARMMQMRGMSGGMGGMSGMSGMGGMGGMGMMGMGMGGMGMMNGGMGMRGMGMGMMNPMMNPMVYGMGGMGSRPMMQNTMSAIGRGTRGTGFGGGPNRMVNRGANNFHPYAR